MSTQPDQLEPNAAAEPDGAAGPRRPPHVEDATEASPQDERVAELLEHTIDVPVLAGAVEQQEAADAADTLESLEEQEAAEVLEQMEAGRDRTS